MSELIDGDEILFQIVQQCTAVELTLIQTEIEEIDRSVAIGVSDLTWNSQGMRKTFSVPIKTERKLSFVSPFRYYGLLDRTPEAG